MYSQRPKNSMELLLPALTMTGTATTSKPSYDHAELFRNLVKYLGRLRKNGEIDTHTFEGLVRRIAANYVEAEIVNRIDRILKNKVSLDRLLDAL